MIIDSVDTHTFYEEFIVLTLSSLFSLLGKYTFFYLKVILAKAFLKYIFFFFHLDFLIMVVEIKRALLFYLGVFLLCFLVLTIF